MPHSNQEQTAIALLIEGVLITRSVELSIRSDSPDDFPNFILFDPLSTKEIWVEVVQAVESAQLIAGEHRAKRLNQAPLVSIEPEAKRSC